jgi:flagellar biosynthesis protein FlhB
MDADRKYPASAKKRREARKNGDIAKSPLLTAAVFLVGCQLLKSAFIQLFQLANSFTDEILSGVGDFHTKDLLVSALYRSGLIVALSTLLVACCGLFALIAEGLQVGFYLSLSQVWKPERLNPISALAQMYSLRGPRSWIVGFCRLFVLLILWLAIVSTFLREGIDEVLTSERNSFPAIAWLWGQWMDQLFGSLSVVAVCLGIIDYSISRGSRNKRLRMTREELRKEFRESEGDPETNAQRRQVHQEITAHEAVANIRNATVVIVD